MDRLASGPHQVGISAASGSTPRRPAAGCREGRCGGHVWGAPWREQSCDWRSVYGDLIASGDRFVRAVGDAIVENSLSATDLSSQDEGVSLTPR